MTKPAAPKRVRVVAAVVFRRGCVLMTQRPPGDALGLLWEFPGGKIEMGETPEHALVREIQEELGVAAEPHEVMAVHAHTYPHGLEVEITFVRASLASDAFVTSEAAHAVRWVAPQAVDLREVLAADRPFLRTLGRGAKPVPPEAGEEAAGGTA